MARAACRSGTASCALLLTFSFSAEEAPPSLSVSLRASQGRGPATTELALGQGNQIQIK